MEHISDVVESHSRFSNDDRSEVVNQVQVDSVFFHFAEFFEEVSGVVQGGEDEIRLEGKVLLKGGCTPTSQEC